MSTYKKMYYTLFNAITEAIESIDDANYGTAKEKLITAQQKAEDIYMEAEEASCNDLLPSPDRTH